MSSKIGQVLCESIDGNKKIDIVDFIQSEFKDHRLITVAKLEDETFLLSVENPQSTGRASQSNMRLTEESLLGLFASCLIYFEHNNIDFGNKLQELINSEEIQYSFTK